MTVSEVVVEVRSGAFASVERTERPDAAQVEALIDQLDQIRCSLVAISCSDGTQIMVGGGAPHFVVTAERGSTVINAITLNPPEPEEDEDGIDIVAGGQSIDYPPEYVLSREEVTQAVEVLVKNLPLPAHWEVSD